MGTAFFNIAIRQGTTVRIPFSKHHGVTAIASSSPQQNTLKVTKLTAAIASGTILKFPSGIVTLTEDAAAGDVEIAVSIDGAINQGDRARGPLYDFSGLSWRGKARDKSGALMLTFDFDESNAAQGAVDLLITSAASAATPANCKIDEWKSIQRKFPLAREFCDFAKLERFLSKANPWYTFDIESFSGDPETVDRHFEGRLVCIAEQTK